MAGEQPSKKAQLVHEKESKANTDDPGSNTKDTAETAEAIARISQRNSHHCGHTHHACHCAGAKNQVVLRARLAMTRT